MREQIDAGAEFLREFEAIVSVRAAFWLKEDESVLWYLFVASEEFEGGYEKSEGYGKAIQVARGMNNPNFDIFRVKLIGMNEPTVRSAMEFYRRYPGRIPAHFYNRPFGSGSVEGAYIYPLPVTAPA